MGYDFRGEDNWTFKGNLSYLSILEYLYYLIAWLPSNLKNAVMKPPHDIKEYHQKRQNKIYAQELKKRTQEATKKRLEDFFKKYGMIEKKKKKE